MVLTMMELPVSHHGRFFTKQQQQLHLLLLFFFLILANCFAALLGAGAPLPPPLVPNHFYTTIASGAEVWHKSVPDLVGEDYTYTYILQLFAAGVEIESADVETRTPVITKPGGKQPVITHLVHSFTYRKGTNPLEPNLVMREDFMAWDSRMGKPFIQVEGRSSGEWPYVYMRIEDQMHGLVFAPVRFLPNNRLNEHNSKLSYLASTQSSSVMVYLCIDFGEKKLVFRPWQEMEKAMRAEGLQPTQMP